MPDKPLPPQVTMGLLPYLSSHTLDEDYAHVADHRDRVGTPPRRRGPMGLAGALVFGVFAILLVTAASQTTRNAVSDEKARQELITQVEARQSGVNADRKRMLALQASTRLLEADLLASNRADTGLTTRLSNLATRAGTVPVRGPGVTVVVDDAPNADSARNQVLDTDLQQLANGLWEAGAEAISVNGNRLTNLSAIRTAGSAITVNYRSLQRPYTVLAIGNPDTLPARFVESTSGQAWLALHNQVGLQFTMTTSRKPMSLPAGPTPDLRFAKPPQKGSKSS